MPRRIQRLPPRAEATGIIVQPTPGALAVMPPDEDPHTFNIHHEGRHKVEARRMRHVITAVQGKDSAVPTFRVAALDDLDQMIGKPYRIPNVRTHGTICWAGTRAPRDLLGFDTVFWSSPFNDHLAQGRFPGWRREGAAKPETLWRRHYARLQADPTRLGISRTATPWEGGHTVKHARAYWQKQPFSRIPVIDSDDTRTEGDAESRWSASYRGLADLAKRRADRLWYEALKAAGASYTCRLGDPFSRSYVRKERGGGVWKAWKALPRDTRRDIITSARTSRSMHQTLNEADGIVRDYLATAKAIGVRIGMRDLPITARTKMQREKEAHYMAVLDRLALHFPALARRHRAYWNWMIAHHRATGKVRKQRDTLYADFMAPYLEGTKEDEYARRMRRVADFFGGGWREYDPDTGEPSDGEDLRETLQLAAYYLGPRTDAVVTTTDHADLAIIPPEYQAVPQGSAGAVAGAFAMRHGDGWALAFPHRKEGLARPWRATCALDGSGLKSWDATAP